MSKYPVQEARARGDLTLTGAGWMVLSHVAYRKDKDSMKYLQYCFKHIFDPGWGPTEEWCKLNEPREVSGWHKMAAGLGDWTIIR